MYTIIVCCETVYVDLLVSAHNHLDIWAVTVMNTCIMAPNYKKVWSTISKKFGRNTGKKVVVIHAVYGLKSYDGTVQDDGCMP